MAPCGANCRVTRSTALGHATDWFRAYGEVGNLSYGAVGHTHRVAAAWVPGQRSRTFPQRAPVLLGIGRIHIAVTPTSRDGGPSFRLPRRCALAEPPFSVTGKLEGSRAKSRRGRCGIIMAPAQARPRGHRRWACVRLLRPLAGSGAVPEPGRAMR